MKSLRLSPLLPDVKATINIPGSKSYTNRALLLAALTPEPVKLLNPLVSEDTAAMIHCLETLGIKVIQQPGVIEVVGDITVVDNREYDLDVNLSGTTLRFLLALAAVIPGVQTIHGGTGLHQRPVSHLVDALRQLGAQIQYLNQDGYPPLRVSSSKLQAGKVTLPASESSQYLSALLMVAPVIGDVMIQTEDELVSKPYINMTIEIMSQFNVKVALKKQAYWVPGSQNYTQSTYVIEGDVSSASYFFAIAALTGATITVTGMNPQSLQADMQFLEILGQMGNKVTYDSHAITVTGRGIQPITVNMQDCPDQAPTLAVLAAFAKGVTTISGIQSLRIKETERIQALEQELQKMDIHTTSMPDALTIHGGKPRPASIATYGDHRMAMSFAVAGTKLGGMEIQDPDVVAKTFPGFWEQLASLNSQPAARNIILIGMRGTGKTTIGKALAKELGRTHLDLDDLIVKRTGLPTAALVKNKGWKFFRDQEAAVIQEVSTLRNHVISTGGGIVLRPENIAALKTHGRIILLQASAEVLAERLAEAMVERPRLTGHQSLLAEIQQVRDERQQLYEAAADGIIDTDSLPPSQVIKRILDLIRQEAT